MILIQDGEIRRERFAEPQTTRIAFSSGFTLPTSPAHWTSAVFTWPAPRSAGNWRARKRRLARVPIDNDTIVVPVAGHRQGCRRCHGLELQCPSVEGLIRNRYVGRTFIDGAQRADRARLKYTPLREVVGRQARAAGGRHHRAQHDHEILAA